MPKGNNSPACRPKMSKTYHTQQHNPQQRISVAALVGRSFYICCPLCRAKTFSWHIHLLPFHHAPLVWLVVAFPVASLHLSDGGSTSCCTLRLLVVAWRCVVMLVPLVVPPTIFKALVVSPLIRAAAAACIVLVIAIQVVIIAPLASGVGQDSESSLAVA